ncbi:MAG: hypothetical protein PHD70_11280 [Anaerostipes sp.]|nr:hypothetical protein [Anaerostipes sp.]
MDDTIELLKECSSGCKMAINSMDEMIDDMPSGNLMEGIKKSKQEHQKIESKIARILAKDGFCEEEPGAIASAFSWMTSKMKLMIHDDENQVAKLMMDGCNMGIQSITEKMHEYKNASKESQDIAKDLVKHEEDFQEELKKYL